MYYGGCSCHLNWANEMGLKPTNIKSRKGLKLHGVSLDLRLNTPKLVTREYVSLPNINELYNERKDDEIMAIFYPLALTDNLFDSNTLFVLIRSLLRGRRNQDALQLLFDNEEHVSSNRNLLFEQALLCSKLGQYTMMEKSIAILDREFGLNGVHSKVLQALLVSQADATHIDAYLEKMEARYREQSSYEVLRAAFNSGSWDLALQVAPKVPKIPRNQLLVMRTYHRTNEKERARRLMNKLNPSKFTESQILDVIRVGVQICGEQELKPWFENSALTPPEVHLELSRGQFRNALSDGDFLRAFEALSTISSYEAITPRDILLLLRSNNDLHINPIQMLYDFGCNDGFFLSSVVEYGFKYGDLETGIKAFSRLEAMALCSYDRSGFVQHYFDAALNSGDIELLRSAYIQLPSLQIQGRAAHDLAQKYEKLLAALGNASSQSASWPSRYIEVLILSELVRNHNNSIPYIPRQRHALVVNNSLKFGGAERQVVRCLSSNDFTKTMVVWNSSVNTPSNSFIEKVEQLGVEVLDYSVEHLSNEDVFTTQISNLLNLIPFTLPYNPGIYSKIRNLVAIIQKDRPSTLHLWQDTTNVLGAIAGLIAGVPRIVMSARSLPPFAIEGSTFPNKGPNYFYNNRYVRDLYIQLLTKDNVFLSHNSENGLNKYIEWLGGFKEKMLLLRNGFDFENLPAQQERKSRKPGGMVVGTVFRFVEVKQPLLWLDVASLVLESHPNTVFKMVGDGPMLDAAILHAQDLRIADKVEFMGYRDDVPHILPTFDAFLLTSSIEGLPNVLIEAQSHGVPVVSTSAGGASETFIVGKTGILVDSFDPVEISQAVCEVIGSDRYRTDAQTIGRDFVISTYSEASMHSQLNEILFEGAK